VVSAVSAVPREPGPLRLRNREFAPGRSLIMAIVNRTPDSFYRPGVTWDEQKALDRAHEIVAEGADILDVGGVPAKPGAEVDVTEEIRRTVPFIEAVRAAYPDLVISVDTWRHEVGRAVCSHAGGLPPRTRPFRIAYDDVMADVLGHVLGLADRALRAGVDPARIIIDPAHDFGKNSWQSLEITRRLAEMTATGWPVLLSASHKDFVGEALGTGIGDRMAGTLAVTTVGAWLGARVFRAHNVPETRQVLDIVAAIRGDQVPARMVRGLA